MRYKNITNPVKPKKSKYVYPDLEIVRFNYADVIATSIACAGDECPRHGDCTGVNT